MKKITVFIIVSICLEGLFSQKITNFCDPDLQKQIYNSIISRDTYLKDFLISPDDLILDENNSKWSYKNTVILQRGTTYRFYIKCSKKNPCEALVTLKEKETSPLILLQVNSEKTDTGAIKIVKTAPYKIDVSFKNNVKGCAIVMFTIVEVETKSKVDSSNIYVSVDENAQFNGGDIILFRQYVAENFHVDSISVKGNFGKIITQFVINTSGKIENVKILRSCGNPKLDEEALRVIYSSPLWKPAKHGGVNVKQQFVLPIKINL